MTGVRALVPLLVLAASCSASGGTSRAASTGIEVLAPAKSETAPTSLGVVTHFAQGWPPALVDQVRDVRASVVRDAVPWAQAEPVPGRYDFSGTGIPALRALCHSHAKLLLLAEPRHPRYDDGQSVNSPAGIAAFATFTGELARHFGSCLTGIQIGNEINDPRNLPYPAGVNGPAAYVATVRAVKAELTRQGSLVSVVAGSTNAIGTGFLETLFAAGLLDVADVVSVHPYRSQAENVDLELGHLRAVMQKHGHVRPIWATEYGDNYRTPDLAADELVKMMTLLGVGGVAQSYWYSLIDEPWFRNMGLFDSGSRPKPAARAFRLMTTLVTDSRPTRVDLGDAGIQLYRLDAHDFVLWGMGGVVAFGGTSKVSDAQGRAVTASSAGVPVGVAPRIITGAGAPRLIRSSGVVADSLFGYARPPWSYLARLHGKDQPLPYTDWTWTSDFFSPYLNPLRINDTGATVAGSGGDPIPAVIRYTAPTAQRLSLSGCFHREAKGDNLDLAVTAAGKTLWHGLLAVDATPTGIDVDLAAGQTLDISAAPVRGPNALSYRVQLFRRGFAQPTPCPQRAEPVG